MKAIEPSSSAWLIVTGDFVRTGGMDRANYALADYLARSGAVTHLVGFRAAETLRSMPTVRFHRVPKPLNSYWLSMPLLAAWGRRAAARLTRAGCDVRVVVNGGNCDWADINWVHYVHRAYAPQVSSSTVARWRMSRFHAAALRAERRIITKARLVVANSEQTRRDILALSDALDERRVRTVYYGIDPQTFTPGAACDRARVRRDLRLDPDQAVGIFIGALGDHRKGFDVVVEAWRRLLDQKLVPPTLLVVGTGREQTMWMQRVADLGLDRFFRFLGFRSDVPELLHAADLLVAPVRYEAYGLGVHEALCCGVPAIVSHHAGVAERYPEPLRQPLLLNDPGDPSELATKLINFKAVRENLQPHVFAFAETLRQRSWDDMAADIVELATRCPVLR